MFKTRLEALTDGIFAIVMTLLVIEIHLPSSLKDNFSEAHLVDGFKELTPIILSFFLSFAVLSTFWISHNFNITLAAKNINRQLAYLNLLFLAFVSVLPFTTSVIGEYPTSSVALATYSLNFLILASLQHFIRFYIIKSDKIENPDFSKMTNLTARDRAYGEIRSYLGVFSGLLALIFSFYNQYATWTFILIPTIIGVIPGLLQFILWITRLEVFLAKETMEVVKEIEKDVEKL